MGEHIQLTAADGHHFDAYLARPAGDPLAALVVLQEAFGVNRHIRSVTDAFAADGFLAAAPALFDRKDRGVELGYSGDELQRGIALARGMNHADTVKDIAATIDHLRRECGKKVGVIGYCFGGSMAWLAATRLDPDAAVGYYGGAIPQYASETPHCPVMLHFGSQDAHIPKDAVDKVQAAHPDVQIFWYDAGHGFDTADRASYNAEASRLALERSLEFLRKHLRT
ncbi:MAG: dienelactone hydrolase family protein [Terriglobales bacterium]